MLGPKVEQASHLRNAEDEFWQSQKLVTKTKRVQIDWFGSGDHRQTSSCRVTGNLSVDVRGIDQPRLCASAWKSQAEDQPRRRRAPLFLQVCAVGADCTVVRFRSGVAAANVLPTGTTQLHEEGKRHDDTTNDGQHNRAGLQEE